MKKKKIMYVPVLYFAESGLLPIELLGIYKSQEAAEKALLDAWNERFYQQDVSDVKAATYNEAKEMFEVHDVAADIWPQEVR